MAPNKNRDEYCAQNRVQKLKYWPTCRQIWVLFWNKIFSWSFLISMKLHSFLWAMLQWLENMKWWGSGRKWVVLVLRYNTNICRKKVQKTTKYFCWKVSFLFNISTKYHPNMSKSANHNVAKNNDSEKDIIFPRVDGLHWCTAHRWSHLYIFP
jgi:hypothetical protein